MPENDFLVFATGPGGNLPTQAEYEADPLRVTGNVPGIARSKVNNKALLQSSLMAAALAVLVQDNQTEDVLDTLEPSELALMIVNALSGIFITDDESGAFGRTLLATATATAARTAMSLGTAALGNTQSSATDTTAGRLLTVGAFGLGGSSFTSVPGDNIDSVAVTGFYGVTSSTSGTKPSGITSGEILHFERGSSLQALQLFDALTGAGGTQRLFTRTKRSDGTWGSWLEIYTSASGFALPVGYFTGFQMSNDTGSPNTSVVVGAGSARDSTNAKDLKLTGSMTGVIQSSGAWAAGTGQPKLDTGARASNTWYHLFAIANTATGVGDILFSTSATSPAMPSGYSGFRRIGAVRTDSSGNILGFINNGDIFRFKTPIQEAYVTGAGVTPTATITTSLPTGVEVEGLFHAAATGNGSWLFVRPLGSNGITLPTSLLGSGYLGGLGTGTNDTTESIGHETQAVTNTSGQVVIQTSGVTSMTYTLVTLGYKEIR